MTLVLSGDPNELNSGNAARISVGSSLAIPPCTLPELFVLRTDFISGRELSWPGRKKHLIGFKRLRKKMRQGLIFLGWT